MQCVKSSKPIVIPSPWMGIRSRAIRHEHIDSHCVPAPRATVVCVTGYEAI